MRHERVEQREVDQVAGVAAGRRRDDDARTQAALAARADQPALHQPHHRVGVDVVADGLQHAHREGAVLLAVDAADDVAGLELGLAVGHLVAGGALERGGP
jgi:hypothetical protein